MLLLGAPVESFCPLGETGGNHNEKMLKTATPKDLKSLNIIPILNLAQR
jgi:hypothetical protein